MMLANVSGIGALNNQNDRRQHHEQRHGHQEVNQKGSGKDPERKKGRKKDQKGREKEMTLMWTCPLSVL
jgi:hypothetical protein